MKIKDWCQIKGMSPNTYYRRLQIVRTELLKQTEQCVQKIVPLSCAMALTAGPHEQTQTAFISSEKVVFRKKDIEIELPQDVSESMLLTLLKGLREC